VEVQGRYRFSPPLNRSGNLTRRDGRTTKWWLIIECDPDLGRYWRWLYEKHHHHLRQLQAPLWGAHVSVIRDEEPPNLELWEQAPQPIVTLDYDHEPQETADYIWLRVNCEAALDYREALGLPRQPPTPLHLTIGNCKANLPED